MNKIDNKKLERIIFVVSIIICLFLGVVLSYNYDFTNSYNLLFDSDTGRVIRDATIIVADHSRLNVHPLYTLLIQPTVLLLSGITLNKMLSLIILSSVITSFTVLFIYKILSLYTKNNNVKTLISLSYLLTTSNIIFTSGIEVYNVATLFLVILFYFVLKKLNEKNINKYTYFILIILGTLSAAFTITNYFIFLIIMGMLFIFKKINLKKTILIVISSLVLLTGLNITQKLIWHNTPLFLNSGLLSESTRYDNKNITLFTKVSNVLENDFSNSILSNKPIVKVTAGTEYNGANFVFNFTDTSIIKLLFMVFIYSLVIILVIRNFKKNKFLNITLLLSLLFNFLLHIVYGNDSTFLYSLHFTYLIYLIAGINLIEEKNKNLLKVSYISFISLLILQIILNSYFFIEIIKNVNEILNKTYFLLNYDSKAIIFELLIILILVGLCILIYKLFKRIKDIKDKDKSIFYKILLVLLFIIIGSIYITINTCQSLNNIIFKNIEPKEETIIQKNKLYYLNKDFKSHYKEELKSLETYLNEYKEFKSNYEVEEVNYLNEYDYYFFGLGNRKKLVYTKGNLIDIDNKEVLYSFNLKEQIIIPNLYSVLIQTKNNDYIKIYEDNLGVHYNKNGKDEIITGTNNELSLYDFSNEKYSNIKKVLYGEILFNIKDNKIYPNILVYDNPWYRDAALTTMVLKKTNSTYLIKEWVENISELYDKQNKGNLEPDNLGELLYILSSQDNINYELVNRIEEEAERIASSNPNGYYLYGKTDYQDEYLYQNLWYKLGIESVGRNFKFDIEGLDDNYSNSCWWSDVKKDFTYEVSQEYPYLSIAYRHNLGSGKLVLNKALYPLSWEKAASEAKYENMVIVNSDYKNSRVSPVHTWTASELLLFIMDED